MTSPTKKEEMPPRLEWFFLRLAYGLPRYDEMIWLRDNYPTTPIIDIPKNWKEEMKEEVLRG